MTMSNGQIALKKAVTRSKASERTSVADPLYFDTDPDLKNTNYFFIASFLLITQKIVLLLYKY